MSNNVLENALKTLSIAGLEYVLKDVQRRINDGVESGHAAYVAQQKELEELILAELDLRKKEGEDLP